MWGAAVKKFIAIFLPFWVLAMPIGYAQEAPVDDSLQVMQAFHEQALAEQEAFELTEQDKHEVLFYMGAVLLILMCATAYLGVNMVVFDKPYFVSHMVCAGLTVTLGLAHAVAAVVWFFPF